MKAPFKKLLPQSPRSPQCPQCPRSVNTSLKVLLPLLLLALPAAVQAQFTFTTNNGAITIT